MLKLRETRDNNINYKPCTLHILQTFVPSLADIEGPRRVPSLTPCKPPLDLFNQGNTPMRDQSVLILNEP